MLDICVSFRVKLFICVSLPWQSTNSTTPRQKQRHGVTDKLLRTFSFAYLAHFASPLFRPPQPHFSASVGRDRRIWSISPLKHLKRPAILLNETRYLATNVSYQTCNMWRLQKVRPGLMPISTPKHISAWSPYHSSCWLWCLTNDRLGVEPLLLACSKTLFFEGAEWPH